MSLASSIYQALKGQPLSAYPVLAPQEAEPPWITYRIDQSSDRDNISYQIDGTLNPYWANFFITIWTPTFGEADSLVEQYVKHLSTFKSDEIQQVFYTGRKDMASADLTMFGIELNFQCSTREV